MLVSLKTNKIDEFSNIIQPILIHMLDWSSNDNFSSSLILLSLINNLRNVAISLTARKFRRQSEFFNTLERKLEMLRINDPTNNSLIDEYTEKLNNLIHLESEGLFRKSNKNFSKYFEKDLKSLSIAVNKVTTTPLSVISDNDGNPFPSCKDRNSHIYNYYKSLYSQPKESLISCNEFLNGIQTKKNSEQESNTLMSDFTYIELDRILKNLNFNSSPGLDLISNNFIKSIYPYIKPLLLRTYNNVKNGLEEVTPEYKTAYIKLIPKSKSPRSLTNWRPITLTSNLYKIYCKLFAERIKKILPNLLGPSQKAYLQNSNISDATLNTLLNIAKSIENKHPLFLVCLDFKSMLETTIIQIKKYVTEKFL